MKRISQVFRSSVTNTNTCKTILFGLVLGLFTFTSCSDDKPNPNPDPDPETESYTMVSKAIKPIDFQQFNSPAKVRDTAPQPDYEQYFGDRVDLFCPKELSFYSDSMSVIRTNGPEEDYKVKWENKKLYIYHDDSESWLYCGEEGSSKGEFLMNTCFYILKTNNAGRWLSVMGQDYWLQSHSDLGFEPDTDNHMLVWLKVNYVFEKSTKSSH